MANLIALLGSKKVTRSWKSDSKPQKQVQDQFSESLKVCQDHNLNIPGGLQALATSFARAASPDAEAKKWQVKSLRCATAPMRWVVILWAAEVAWDQPCLCGGFWSFGLLNYHENNQAYALVGFWFSGCWSECEVSRVWGLIHVQTIGDSIPNQRSISLLWSLDGLLDNWKTFAQTVVHSHGNSENEKTISTRPFLVMLRRCQCTVACNSNERPCPVVPSSGHTHCKSVPPNNMREKDIRRNETKKIRQLVDWVSRVSLTVALKVSATHPIVISRSGLHIALLGFAFLLQRPIAGPNCNPRASVIEMIDMMIWFDQNQN